jgi:hypothetical protein
MPAAAHLPNYREVGHWGAQLQGSGGMPAGRGRHGPVSPRNRSAADPVSRGPGQRSSQDSASRRIPAQLVVSTDSTWNWKL